LAFGFSAEGFVPGCDYAGVVQEVGTSVKKVKKGDRVRSPPPSPLLTDCRIRLPVGSMAPRCGRDTAPTPNLFELTAKTCSGFPKAFRLTRLQPLASHSRQLLWDSTIRSSCLNHTVCMTESRPPSSSGVVLVSVLTIFANFKQLRCDYVRLSRNGSHPAGQALWADRHSYRLA
jgi:hypothetical protein